MDNLPKTLKWTSVFVATFVCVCAAAETVNHTFAQIYLDLQADADTNIPAVKMNDLVGSLAYSGSQQLMVSNGLIPYTASLEPNVENGIVAKFNGEAPTLFFKFLGVPTLPVKVEIDMIPNSKG